MLIHGFNFYNKKLCSCEICSLSNRIYKRYRRIKIYLPRNILEKLCCYTEEYKQDNTRLKENFYKFIDEKLKELNFKNKTKLERYTITTYKTFTFSSMKEFVIFEHETTNLLKENNYKFGEGILLISIKELIKILNKCIRIQGNEREIFQKNKKLFGEFIDKLREYKNYYLILGKQEN